MILSIHEDQHTDLTDYQLREAYIAACENLSYYNAAEGIQWTREAPSRAKAQRLYGSLRQSLKARGLKPPTGNWLI
jgi:hypothetical protein